MPELSFRVIVGRLLCSQFRDILEGEIFRGKKIRWREGRGWIDREFSVIGEVEDVKNLAERINLWAKAMNQ